MESLRGKPTEKKGREADPRKGTRGEERLLSPEEGKNN